MEIGIAVTVVGITCGLAGYFIGYLQGMKRASNIWRGVAKEAADGYDEVSRLANRMRGKL